MKTLKLIIDIKVTDADYYPLPQDFKEFGEDQGFKWDEGFSLDALVSFNHEGSVIVNPYSYTQGDPAELFGTTAMDAWKQEAASLMNEWAADAA